MRVLIPPDTQDHGNAADQVSSANLEEAITAMDQQVADLKQQLAAAKAMKPGATIKQLQTETDQLHHEITTLLKDQHEENLNMMNGIRLLLNTFGEEMGGTDVSNLIEKTNKWLDAVIKPIAQSREEAEAARSEKARERDQDGDQRSENIVHEMANQAHSQQQDLPLEQEQSRDDGRDV